MWCVGPEGPRSRVILELALVIQAPGSVDCGKYTGKTDMEGARLTPKLGLVRLGHLQLQKVWARAPQMPGREPGCGKPGSSCSLSLWAPFP